MLDLADDGHSGVHLHRDGVNDEAVQQEDPSSNGHSHCGDSLKNTYTSCRRVIIPDSLV